MFLSSYNNIQFSSVIQSCLTLCDPINCSTTGFPVHHQLLETLKLVSMVSVMPSNHLLLCLPLLLLPSIFPSIRIFSNESVLPIRWPNYWSFSFSISPSNEYSGLISFMIIWLDLLAVQGTLKSLLQHHSSKTSILQWFNSIQSLSCVRLFATPWTIACQAPLSMGFLQARISSVQFSSVTQLCLTLCEPMDCSTPGLPVLTNSQSLLKLTSIESVMPSNHLILCHPLLLPPSIFPSIKVFSNESVLRMRWPKDWSFSFNMSPSEYSGLISFRIDWLDLLAVQGTFKSLL